MSQTIRKRASKESGIPAAHFVISATHWHSAPDYMKERYLKRDGEQQTPLGADYTGKVMNSPVEAIVKAHDAAKSVVLELGLATSLASNS